MTADYAVPNDATEVMDGVTTKETAVKAVNEAAANAAVVGTAVERFKFRDTWSLLKRGGGIY